MNVAAKTHLLSFVQRCACTRCCMSAPLHAPIHTVIQTLPLKTLATNGVIYNCKYRQHTSSCRSTPAWALSSSLTTSMWPPLLACIRAVLPLHCTREVEREIATDYPEIYNLCFMSQPQALLHSTGVAICHSLIPRPCPRGEGLVAFSQFLGLEPLH